MAKKRIMRAFKIDEISAVDKPAQAGALALIMKRAKSDTIGKGAVLTTNDDGHSHLIYCLEDSGGTTSYSQMVGESDTGHSHPYVITAEGKIVIGEAEGHSHEALVFGKVEELVNIVKNLTLTKEDPMTKEEIDALNKKHTDELAAKDAAIAKNAADLAKANKIAAMNDVQKAHYNSLSEIDKEVFLAKSIDEQNAIIKNLESANPVVYKAADGSEFRKNDDPRLVAMAKAADANAKVAKAATEALEKSDLEKRAAEMFPNSPGTVEEKGAMLKALESISDETVRKNAIASAKAGDAALAAAFTRKGHGGGSNPDNTSADELDKMAKKHAADNNVSYAKAYDAVIQTEAGAKLYDKVAIN